MHRFRKLKYYYFDKEIIFPLIIYPMYEIIFEKKSRGGGGRLDNFFLSRDRFAALSLTL